jgi:hypothetical protein
MICHNHRIIIHHRPAKNEDRAPAAHSPLAVMATGIQLLYFQVDTLLAGMLLGDYISLAKSNKAC